MKQPMLGDDVGDHNVVGFNVVLRSLDNNEGPLKREAWIRAGILKNVKQVRLSSHGETGVTAQDTNKWCTHSK